MKHDLVNDKDFYQPKTNLVNDKENYQPKSNLVNDRTVTNLKVAG